jgi:hypothetical protein
LIGVVGSFEAGRNYEKTVPRELTMVNVYSVSPTDSLDIIWSTWRNAPYATKDGQCDRLSVTSSGGENWLEMNVPVWLGEQLYRIEATLAEKR